MGSVVPVHNCALYWLNRSAPNQTNMLIFIMIFDIYTVATHIYFVDKKSSESDYNLMFIEYIS